MTPEEHLKAGNIDEALTGLQDAIRKAPADARLRRFLFQLHCVNGKWDKALTQLNVLADMDPESMLLAEIFRPVIACEVLRTEVFEGKRTALIFGEPEPWVGWTVQAGNLAAQGNFTEAKTLQDRALEAAPAYGGTVNGEAFEWIGDADSRLGPLLEAFIDNKYYWIPFIRLAKLEIEAPSDLRDLVWVTAKFSWTNGGESNGLIPVRYPGSAESPDSGIRLSRKTDWAERTEGYFFGLGQRTLATNAADYPLLEIRTIEFAFVPAPESEAEPVSAPEPAPAE